jgi:hypothetical protein
MKIKCHNQTCQHVWEYNGKLPYTWCPLCTSKIPISKQLGGEFVENISKDTETKSIKSPIKSRLKLWLLEHPKFNFYNYLAENDLSYEKGSNRINPYNLFRIITSSIRVLPDFILFGGTRSGVMTLTKYIQEHPNVYTVRNVHFFEYTSSNKVEWYKRHFPTNFYKNYFKLKHKQKLVVGESTGTYLFHSEVSKRIKEHIPNVKLIVMLKNPIKTIYSRYYVFRNEGLESSSFEDVIKMEMERIKIGDERNELRINNPEFGHIVNFNYLRHCYYAEKLKNWLKEFKKEQILILTNDEFNTDIDKTLKKTFEFLDLPNHTIKNKIKHNVGKYPKMHESTRKLLVDYFRPHNQELYNLIGKELDWDK